MAQPNYELCDKPCPHARDCARYGISPNTAKCKIDPNPVPPDIEFFKNPGKIEMMHEMVGNTLGNNDDKLLVFAHFRAELDMLEKLSRDLEYPVYRIDGGIKDAHAVTRAAAKPGESSILLAQISCGVGWNFVECHKAVYYSMDFSFESYKQSRDRIMRMGQACPVSEWHIHGRNSLDPLTKKLMDKKELIFETLMSGECKSCEHFHSCTQNGIEKWTDECVYAKAYRRPDLELWRHEMEITKWAEKMV
jgi:SNF2 family DNA or RNA helicase